MSKPLPVSPPRGSTLSLRSNHSDSRSRTASSRASQLSYFPQYSLDDLARRLFFRIPEQEEEDGYATSKARVASISQALEASPTRPSFSTDIHLKPLPPKPSRNSSNNSHLSGESRVVRLEHPPAQAPRVSQASQRCKASKPKSSLTLPPSPGPPPSTPLPPPPMSSRPTRPSQPECIALSSKPSPSRNNTVPRYSPTACQPNASKKRHPGHFFDSFSTRDANSAPSTTKPLVSFRSPPLASTTNDDNSANSDTRRNPPRVLKSPSRTRPVSLPLTVRADYVYPSLTSAESSSKKFSLRRWVSGYADPGPTTNVTIRNKSVNRNRSRMRRLILRRPPPLLLTPTYIFPDTPSRSQFQTRFLDLLPNLLILGVLVHWFWILRIWMPVLPKLGKPDHEGGGREDGEKESLITQEKMSTRKVGSGSPNCEFLAPDLSIRRRGRQRGCNDQISALLGEIWRSVFGSE